MNPKPARQLINLNGYTIGLAGHYAWEKEVLVDYIAHRFLTILEDVQEDAKAHGIVPESEYLEMLKIAAALRKHPGSGMATKIELGGAFHDLRDFVEWSKEELSDYLIHQIVRCDLGAVFETRMGQHQAASEICELAAAIYLQAGEDGFRKAEAERLSLRNSRDARRNEHAARVAPEIAPTIKPVRPRAAA